MDETRSKPAKPDGNKKGLEGWREAELQRLVADIAARLRKSCADLPDEEFAKLVLDIAQRRMRFDGMDPTSRSARESRD